MKKTDDSRGGLGRGGLLALCCAVVLAPATFTRSAHAQGTPPPAGAPTETGTPPAGTRAAQAGALGLDEVLRSVETSYPLLRAAELDRDIADGDLLAAQGGFDATWKTRASSTPLGYYNYHRVDSVVEVPTTLWGSTFFGGYRIGRGDFPSYYGSYETLSKGEFRAGVSVPVVRNGPTDRRRATIARAEAGQIIADKSVDQARLDLARTATTRYWDWVAAGRRLATVKKLLATAVERDAGLAARVQRGDLPAIERVDNQRTILSRQSQLVTAERQLQQAGFELALYLRGADGSPVQPSPDRLPEGLPEPTALAGNEADLIAAALAKRPEMARFEAQRRQLQAEVAYAKNQRLPAVDLQIVGSRDFGADAVYARRPTVLEASVLIDIPLQNRAATGRADAATAQLARLEAQARFARDRITTDVRDARSAIETARQRVDVARREVSLAVELERAERSRFELGDSTLLVVNLREQATADAALREIDALLDYQRAAASRRAAQGDGLPSQPSQPKLRERSGRDLTRAAPGPDAQDTRGLLGVTRVLGPRLAHDLIATDDEAIDQRGAAAEKSTGLGDVAIGTAAERRRSLHLRAVFGQLETSLGGVDQAHPEREPLQHLRGLGGAAV